MRGRALASRDDLHVVLVHPEIPANTGNVGRSCLAAGAQLHLIEPLGFSLATRAVRRAGLDYWPRVAPRTWPDWEAFEAALPALGEPLFFSADAERTLWQAPIPKRCVLVFGRESTGLPEPLRARHRERLVGLPMADPELRSLNLASTVTTALYEVLRRRA
jgi:tRNA (cytidine/uridine-2'-O-)-methyltransferase